MTNVEDRIRKDLPELAEALLASNQSPVLLEDTDSSPSRDSRRVLLVAAALTAAVVAGFVLRAQVTPPADVIRTAAQVSRVEGLDSETVTLFSDAMAPAIPKESPVLLFEVADGVVLQRGDLVIVPSRMNSEIQILRRIVGLPGDAADQDGNWIPGQGRTGDASPVTNSSAAAMRNDTTGFGYVVTADNPSFAGDGALETFAHNEIRLWAPADTSAIPPLLEAERAELIQGLRTCLDSLDLDTTRVDLGARSVFDDLFREVEDQGVDKQTWIALAECTERYAALSR